MQSINAVLSSIHKNIIFIGRSCEHLIPVYSVLTLSGYLIFGYLNRYIKVESLYSDIWLRILSIVLLVSLLVYYFLQKQYTLNKFFLYLLWFFVVTVNQSFFFSFILLQNNFSQLWSLNAIISYSFLLIIFDWITAFILISIGILLAIFLFMFSKGNFHINDSFVLFVSAFISLLTYGALFSYKRKTQEEIITARDNLTYQSAAIAHEMRTPLGNINMIGHALKSMVTRHTDKSADSQKQLLLKHNEVDSLEHLADNLRDTVKAAQTFIDLMLANLKQDVSDLPCTHLSMAQCIEKIITVYPLTEQERQIIHMNIEHDFIVFGNEDFLQHVVFNLLKNSLYFIHAGNKGEIFITTQISETQNSLIFKDTGPGIESKKLANIFKPFHSTRPHGTGIGLAFCKKVIESFGGKIKVTSQCGEHTTFTISFTKSKEVC